MSDTTETPKTTLNAATRRNALPPARLSLLGTLHAPDEARALIRVGGSVSAVRVGDQVGDATVTAIDESGILMARGARVERLELPVAR